MPDTRAIGRDDRRIIVEALRRAAVDTRQAMSCWEPGGNIAKMLGANAAEVAAPRIKWFAAMVHAQERLATEIENESHEIAVTRRGP